MSPPSTNDNFLHQWVFWQRLQLEKSFYNNKKKNKYWLREFFVPTLDSFDVPVSKNGIT